MKDFTFDSADLVAFCKRFESTLQNITNDPMLDISESMLEVTLQDLNERWANLQKSYRALCVREENSTSESLTSVRTTYSDCTGQFHTCKAKIVDLQKAFVAPPSFHSNDLSQIRQVNDDSFTCIKVPPCDSEIFYGGYEEWPSFRDMFSAVYVDHPKLSAVQKLYHLRLKVRGQAGGIVKKYKLCGENFALAWEALRSRYENKRILVDNQLKILLSLKSISLESSEALQDIQATINDCLAALKAQSIPTNDWDPILVYLCSTKLPHETLSLWEQSLDSHRDLPKWNKMDAFLSNRYEVVERLNSIQGVKPAPRKKTESDVNSFGTEGTVQQLCKFCGRDDHNMRSCPEFKKLEPKSRYDYVSQNKICVNCLSQSHIRKDCKSKHVCLECKKNHHTLLHFPTSISPKSSPGNTSFSNMNSRKQDKSFTTFTQAEIASQTTSLFLSNQIESASENTLLPTAIVQISRGGDTFSARAFLDQGSEKTFISKRLQQRLMLPCKPKNYQIRGIGGNVVTNSNALCCLDLYSKRHDQLLSIEAIVVPKITRLLPNFFVPVANYSVADIEELDLADPDFHSPGHVDLLIGSNVIPKLLLDGLKKVCESLLAQATIFGWVISGPLATRTVSLFSIETTEISHDPIERELRRFWEQEEVTRKRPLSSDDEYCDSLYSDTTVQNSEGRFVVKLPFKPTFSQDLQLGPSRSIALIQYLKMEQSLQKKPELATIYHDVLKEYISLGHMSPTSSNEILSKNSYHSFYLPHHSVVKPDSTTTKVRVVFNASRRTHSGLSLNDVLFVGPTLQSDLTTLILNWRLYKYVFCGDIEKMYRQIRVHDDDTAFQRILFRPSPTSPILDYALKTVTFGVNCAPYLAIRTLHKLASDNETTFPQASRILMRETYVDDILSGAHDPTSAIDSLNQLISLLKSAGFPLRKITSNCQEVLALVPQEHLLNCDFLKFQDTSTTKTLGIQWNAMADCFSYKISHIPICREATKRQILSTVSKLFDPAGWLSPFIIQAKILLQHLWLEGIKWDDPVSSPTLRKWNTFLESLAKIPQIEIPRWVQFVPRSRIQIHGFCDASEQAYCAAIYLRVQNEDKVQSNLLVSKGRVAPIDSVSLPRLELCGAVLLSELMRHILSQLPINNYDTYLWCDSSIVLGWLQKPPHTWKTYIANRTSQILRNIGNCDWRHIRSAENPADLGTRGCDSQDLALSSLWWHGPNWLVSPPEEWPKSLNPPENLPDMKKVDVFYISEECPDILERFSRWDKAIRIMCYIYRFVNRTRKRPLPGTSRKVYHSEFVVTKNLLLVLTQKRHYYREYSSLSSTGKVSTKSSLFPFNPFIDDTGIIRINGRIANSNLPYNERHPVILPVKSKYCELLINFMHNLLMHAEHNLMIRTVRNEYYVCRLRSAIKKCIRGCKTCTIYKQRVQSQIMAALPTDRSSFSLPFTITGLDFAGPFPIKESLLRQATYHKGYVCVFVCFSTKALHLELCSDLSSGAFLAAFTRFVGRRGLPKKLMSDNGTNFVGAGRLITREYQRFIQNVSQEIADKYTAHGFEWTFIPPNAPHMGGLWEAGVKSFKMHFKKVAQNQKFTYEEFSTLLTRIEAVLNSRPLSPITDDPQEILALTPGHFLRGAPMISAPETSPTSLGLCDRWDRLKHLQHQFARRWKDEYLKDLQKRYRWQQPQQDVRIGQLVVVKDDLLPPCDWRLGRIRRVYQGPDSHVRVADVRTQNGTITRPIVKLCILPMEENPNRNPPQSSNAAQ